MHVEVFTLCGLQLLQWRVLCHHRALVCAVSVIASPAGFYLNFRLSQGSVECLVGSGGTCPAQHLWFGHTSDTSTCHHASTTTRPLSPSMHWSLNLLPAQSCWCGYLAQVEQNEVCSQISISDTAHLVMH